jgi:tRNA nucleotidyltransferase (CCA-adding enzyme)
VESPPHTMADYIYMMASRLTPEQQRGVKLVEETARAHAMNVYLTGGAVRDIISGQSIRDLDFAVQGNALKLQKDLEKAGAVMQGMDENLRTIYVLLPGNIRGEITSTRAETYDKPGKPPEIAPSTIHDDLRRRDFSMNAMALSLNPGSRGLLLDPFNGVADIEGKLIRVLHNYSFLEEPSRLIRATRFAARLGYELEERTKARFATAKENDYISHINKRMIGHEIESVAHEDDPLKVMKALESEGWMKVLHGHWNHTKADATGLNHLLKMKETLQNNGFTVDAGPAIMYFLTDKLSSGQVAELQSAIPRKAFVQAWKHLEDEAKDFAKRLTQRDLEQPSATWKFLQQAKPESILFTAVTTKNHAAEKKIHDFFGKWREMRSKLPFPQMAEMRITPELPEYPKIMEEAFLLLIDGKLRSESEIVKFLTPHKPPEPPPPPAPVRRGRAKKVEPKGAAQARPQAQAAATATAKPAKKGAAAAGSEPVKAVAQAVGKAMGTFVKAVTAGKSAVKPQPQAKPASSSKLPVSKAVPKKSVKPKAKPAGKPKPAKKSSKPKKKAKR